MVNVDIVYKTVLYILNKEQRGYITPDEFNKLGTQVQLEIFEQYFEELNQQLRLPENDSEYANRVKNLDEKIDIFKTTGTTTYNGAGNPPYFYGPSDIHRLGTVIYKDEKQVQKVQRNDFLLINKSPLTKPTTSFPVYIDEGEHQSSAGPPPVLHPVFYVYPTTIATSADITISYIKKPANPVWNYSVNTTTGAFIYTDAGSTQFELHPTEQVNIILQILLYSGIIIRDPQIIQSAAKLVQEAEIIEKT
jgi:hypothetical protein